MKSRILSLVAFTAWLESKHERSVIGEAGDDQKCPLVRFIKSTTGKTSAVGSSTFRPDTTVSAETKETKLPVWAKNFVSVVDDLNNDRVTAGRALRIVRNTNITRRKFNVNAMVDRLDKHVRF